MKEIIKLYEKIGEIYLELGALELYGENEGITFKNLIDLLKECLIKEDELLDGLIKDYEYDYDKIFNMILYNECLIDEDIKKRMYDYVIMYKLLYDRRINFVSSNFRLNRLYMSSFRNMYLIYFSFLQDFINGDIDYDTKIELLNLKYTEPFFNHDMENTLILNNFNVSSDNYVDLDVAEMMANLSNGKDEVVANYVDIILGLVYEILDFDDSCYTDSEELVFLIKNQCMFRACISLISEDEYKMISAQICNIINSRKNDNNKNSVMLINSIVDMRIKDKERIKRLSLIR